MTPLEERIAKVETTVDYIKDRVDDLLQYQREQNGNVAKLWTAHARIDERVKLCETDSMGKGKAASIGAILGSAVAAIVAGLAKIFGGQ